MGGTTSHRDQKLHSAFLARGWLSRRLNGDLYVFESATDKLLRVADPLADLLAETPPEVTLTAAVNQAVARTSPLPLDGDELESDGWTVPLRLLGVRIDVHCAYEECADGIRAYYSAALEPDGPSSPEVIVRCTRPTADRYLFRAREDAAEGTPLDGVTVQTLGTPPVPWTSSHQPLPPLAVGPFADRFVALHAAVVATKEGRGVLIAGERGSGKTTTALALANDYGCVLLADETAFVLCRTTVAMPLPHAVGIWQNGHKTQVPVGDVCDSVGNEAVNLSRLVLLERRPGTVESRPLNSDDALRHLLPHHRHGGASSSDAMATIFDLVSAVPASLVGYEDYQDPGPAVAEFAT